MGVDQEIAWLGPDEIAGAGAPDATGLHRAIFTAHALYGPINAAVTVVNSLIVAVVLATEVPLRFVLAFTAPHLLVAARTLWHPRGPRPMDPHARRRRAIGWGAIGGAAWGAGALFLPHVPPLHQLVIAIAAVGMMGGASTTLAAVPRAAAAFICTTSIPYAIYCLLQTQLAYTALAALAAVYTLSMLAASRLVYQVLVKELQAREQKEALMARFVEEQRDWQELSETSEAFALFDVQDRLVLWNQNLGRTLGLPKEVLRRGISRHDLLAQATRPADVQEGRRSVEEWLGELLALDTADGGIEHRLSDGRTIRSSARRTPSGRTVTVHVDVTTLKGVEAELRRREVELVQSQKLEALGKLAGGIAHDFNNTLTAILGYGDRLRNALEARPELSAEAEEIVQAAQRAAGLTRQLLAFSRKQPLSPRIVDLNATIGKLRNLLMRLVREDVELSFELCPGSLDVKVDPHQMEQVLVNLVANARDAIGEGGGKIAIQTRRLAERPVIDGPGAPGPWGSLVVRDTGSGMTAEVASRVFEPFFTTKALGQGTGLGLSTAYGTIRQSGGDLRVFSQPGRGSAFEVLLPLTHERTAPPTAPPAKPRRPGHGRVLLAEDDGAVRGVLGRMLREAGYEVLEASRGEEAVEILRARAGELDLVVSDVVMPGIGGAALAAEVERLTPGVRVLLISGYAPQLDLAQLGPSVTLASKPLGPDELLRRVAELLPPGP